MSGERTREWVKIRFPNKILGNLSYNTWTQEEDEKLLHALDTNMSISEISKVHKRIYDKCTFRRYIVSKSFFLHKGCVL